MSEVYLYQTAVRWLEQRKGIISCDGKPDVEVATPPEFKGHEGFGRLKISSWRPLTPV